MSTDRGGGSLAAGEKDQLVYQLETRMAAHRDAAAAAVREAEAALTDARERLVEAEESAERAGYVSDPLPFMRQSVDEEVETLERVSNEKKVRASYRFLLDRAVELAAAEVQRFHDDIADEQRERSDGLEACRAAVQRAEANLEAAHRMQERVHGAEDSARTGLARMVAKLS